MKKSNNRDAAIAAGIDKRRLIAAGARTAEQAAQAGHNKPRSGFVHNCYTHPLGRLFQESIKGAIERVIGVTWPLLVRYRCNGDKAKTRDALKAPELAFVYDDPLFELLDRVLKDSARETLTDNDAQRKQEIARQVIDLTLTLAFEDVYYRIFLKEVLANLLVELAQCPELLELDKTETEVDLIFNHFIRGVSRKKDRQRSIVKVMEEAEAMRRREDGAG